MLLARHSKSPSSSKYHQFWTTQKGADQILLAVSSCDEKIQTQEPLPTLPGEIRASEGTEVAMSESEAETLGIELRDPVELD
jgi:hypothetical protein